MNQSLLILLLMCIGAVVYGICRIALIIARSCRRESRFLGDADLQVLLASYQYGKAGEAARQNTAAHAASAPKAAAPSKTDARRRPVRRASRRIDAAAVIRRDRSKRSRETRRFRPAEKRRSVRPRAVRTGASEKRRRERR